MPFEMIVGLRVTDAETYTRYRAAIAPLLAAAGGRFRYDFEIGRTLHGEAGVEINRLFFLSFPSAEARDEFFAGPQYRAARAAYFEPSVSEVIVLGEVSTPEGAG